MATIRVDRETIRRGLEFSHDRQAQLLAIAGAGPRSVFARGFDLTRGNAIDFCVKVLGLSFNDAMRKIFRH